MECVTKTSSFILQQPLKRELNIVSDEWRGHRVLQSQWHDYKWLPKLAMPKWGLWSLPFPDNCSFKQNIPLYTQNGAAFELIGTAFEKRALCHFYCFIFYLSGFISSKRRHHQLKYISIRISCDTVTNNVRKCTNITWAKAIQAIWNLRPSPLVNIEICPNNRYNTIIQSHLFIFRWN